MDEPIKLMNEMCYTLTDMERVGIRIDTTELVRLELEFEEELGRLKEELEELSRDALKDIPFNLSSNDDLSMLIYSRRPKDKNVWASTFNLGTEIVNGTRRPKRPTYMDKKTLANKIERLTNVIYKQTAYQCSTCSGTGKVSRHKKDGNPSKPVYKCPVCLGTGIDYIIHMDQIAGFKQKPKSVHDLAAHGYKCSKEKLNELARSAKGDAKKFLSGMVKFNAINHYLSSFISGIKDNVGDDGILHTSFMQCVTATGRLSSRSPNFQNQPRGGTFPIRKVIISRWEGGSILEADYAQLEFRVAAELSKDPQALQDILDGVDVHSVTASILTQAGQETDRQGAKEHTFKPLYGGTTGTEAEQTYYKAFLDRYAGIKAWHDKLLTIATAYKSISLPSGRRYKFPWAEANDRGYVSGSTKIKNYPVQGFATGDIVPLAVINVHNKLKEMGMKSLLINTVHDSLVLDIYPGELEEVADIVAEAMLGVSDEVKRRFNRVMTVPLAVEIKAGPNWLEMDVIKEVSQ